MSPKTLKIVAVLLVMLALGLGFTGWRLTQQAVPPSLTESAIESATEAPARQHPAVVATRDLRAGTELQAENVTDTATGSPMLAVVDFPNALPQSFAERNALEGRVLTRPIEAGEVIRKEDFALGSVLARQIPAGYRALAIGVDEVIGGGGFIVPGDRVDVLFQARAAESGDRRQTLARRLLEDVLVLGYGDDLRGGVDDQRDDNGRNGARTAVVAVNEAQAPKLLLAESTGRLRLAVVGSRERIDDLMANLVTAPDGQGDALVLGLPEDRSAATSRSAGTSSDDALAPAVTYADIAAIDDDDQPSAAPRRADQQASGHRVVQFIGSERRVIQTQN
ncbi:pilus assembly protein CpaB [Chromohalobacter marismortui]|uniref:Pilus assembly protein CpaB n=1 Tax=Chromohalobacter marismortui TaxID=42055 RepID=A0A4R7NVR0_9GAMM|nr:MULTISPECIES: Flp pilus assembly protein CpaB [Chromohalobacter]MCI0510317.1 Flp pilus assembly protein CpaB [Chromohalobacter sp.]MCI0594012.1 Flp pilus assembly protein CpaB [Chromohalobacter sp.]TDU25108.1 pilus assembly protein CpaB [Chromohalobacter marismortui]